MGSTHPQLAASIHHTQPADAHPSMPKDNQPLRKSLEQLFQSPAPQTTKESTPPPVIFRHQEEAFKKLLRIGRACFAMGQHGLSLRPRCHSLIVGPTGTGKSFLANAVATELNVPILRVNLGEWVLIGCSQRGARNTWPLIFDFLVRHQKKTGVVIFIDELDKLFGNTAWEVFLRNELFLLLDLQIPSGIMKDDDDDEPDEERMRTAQNTLASKTLILGAGAFQHLWDERTKPTLGFGERAPSIEPTSLNHLTKTLPAELTNRFRSDLIALPHLGEADYRRILADMAEKMPTDLRPTFVRMGEERIAEAAKSKQACRFLEELIVDVVIDRWVSEPDQKPKAQHGPSESLDLSSN